MRDNRLTVTQANVTLPVLGGLAQDWERVLISECPRPQWIGIDAASITDLAAEGITFPYGLSGFPFDLHVRWIRGGGFNSEAFISVQQGTRFSVFSRGIEIRARNRVTSHANRIAVGLSQSREDHQPLQWEGDFHQLSTAGNAYYVPIPPFAQSVNFRVTVWDRRNELRARTYNWQGIALSEIPLGEIPAGGIPLGHVARLDVILDPSATGLNAWTPVFNLGL